MNAARLVGSTGLFAPDQVDGLEALLSSLSREQALWLSGYLAALGAPPPGAGEDAHAASATSADPLEVTVLYGTETGNAQEVAEQLVEKARARGIRAHASDMAEYRTKDLRRAKHLAVISATHGEGDPPDPARGFFEFLSSRKAPDLEGASFAVLSLGDSSYVEFCKAGRDLDARLEELGARRMLDRVDCDVDFHEAADDWVTRLVETLAAEGDTPSGGRGADAPAVPGVLQALHGNDVGAATRGRGSSAGQSEYSRRSPYRAEILDSTPLVGLSSDKETLHLELAVEEGALTFEPGDSLGVVAENEDRVLDAVLGALKASPDAPVRIGEEDKPLRVALKHDVELTLVTPAFLKAWAEVAATTDLEALLEEGDRKNLLRFLKCHQVPDILTRYPVPGLEPQTFVGMLRTLQPRLYSIASSRKWTPDQVDLVVAVTRYTADGKRRNGVASSFLADRRTPGQSVDVFVDRNARFKLPDDPDAAVIMIGAGTGVAPYRAFMQERVELGASGRSWLVFGERRFREDFLYQTEWQRFLKDGLLTRMDVAFSRDEAEKVYVQHRLRDRGREVYAWLEEGAFVYVCGDADGMAPGVEQALIDIVRVGGNRSTEEAGAYVRALKDEGRYQRDVY